VSEILNSTNIDDNKKENDKDEEMQKLNYRRNRLSFNAPKLSIIINQNDGKQFFSAEIREVAFVRDDKC
jgi:hypothetical protein